MTKNEKNKLAGKLQEAYRREYISSFGANFDDVPAGKRYDEAKAQKEAIYEVCKMLISWDELIDIDNCADNSALYLATYQFCKAYPKHANDPRLVPYMHIDARRALGLF